MNTFYKRGERDYHQKEKVLVSIIEEIQKNDAGANCVTLLGYKSFGRGLKMLDEKPIHTVDMKEIIKCADKNWIYLGLDTRAVQNYSKALTEAGINELLMTSKEGVFSMYVDAVKSIIAQDSYSNQTIPYTVGYHDKDRLDDVIKKHFPFDNTTAKAVMEPF
jgi:hypothetical protein